MKRLFAAVMAVLCCAAGASAQQNYPADYAKIVDAAKKEGKLVVYSTTDAASAGALLKDFQSLYPGVQVEYSDLNSTELYNRFIAEAAAGSGTADVLWSSAMDLQIKLVHDGQALTYASPEIPALPKWAVWKDQAYGTTYEPITFVYNKRLVPAGDVPQTRAALINLLQTQPAKYKGKITTYDIEKVGVGFNALTQDARVNPQMTWQLVDAIGATGPKLGCVPIGHSTPRVRRHG